MSPLESRPPRRWPWFLLALVVAAVPLAWALRAARPAAKDYSALTAVVREGPLTISVTQTGTILPVDREVIKSKVQGRTTVLSVAAEGSRVKKGDLLLELDCTALKEDLFERELKIQTAEAAFIRAREELAIIQNETQSEIEKAELAHRFAREDLTKYVEGDYPQELKQSEAKIALADEEFQRAAEKLKWSRKLFDEKYISQTELQADALSVKKAELDLDLARGNLKVLKEYTYKRRMAELESAVKQTNMALDRARRKATANVLQAEADAAARKSEFERLQQKQAELKEQVEAARIYAPCESEVVYATSAGGGGHGWRGDREPLAEGSEVREGEDLMYLPSTQRMMALVKIHESNLKKVTIGLSVSLTVDAIPGRVFVGTVSRIAPLPDQASIWFNPDLKVYETQVNIEADGEVLRSGMSCTAEILAEELPHVLYVPLQCVVMLDGQPTVFVADRGATARRPVQIGKDNNRMVHIVSGLKAGEKVLLAPPLQTSERPTAARARPERGNRPPAEAPARPPASASDAEKGRADKADRVGGPARRRPDGATDNRPAGTPAARPSR